MSHDGDFDIEKTEKWLEDDFYSFLNVASEATDQEISNAYRKLSKIYHPDKHRNPVRKKEAEMMFNKIKVAYEVLSDPHKRAIYDTIGVKGLETSGWEVAQRTKTPQEIRDEYERLEREQEERRLQQRTNPKGNFIVSVNATDLFESYGVDGYQSLPQIEINQMSISQSVEAPLTATDTLILGGLATSQNGNGAGNVHCSLRRVLPSSSWVEVDVGAGNGVSCQLKGLKPLGKLTHVSMVGSLQFIPYGVKPGFQAVLTRQLDKNFYGQLTWKALNQSALCSTLVWENELNRISASIQFGLPVSYVSASYIRKLPEDKGKIKGSIKLGTFGVTFEYGCEKKISSNSIIGANMSIGVPSGVVLKIRVHRASQDYIFPIMLSQEILPMSVFYGTLTPLLSWYVVTVLIINPHLRRQKLREIEKNKEANAVKIAKRRAEAEASIALMKETVLRVREHEETRQGVIIVQALYGKLLHNDSNNISPSDFEVIDVTIPLQCLVNNSKLILHGETKSNLPGFYDPCLGEKKGLYVQYKFHNELHEVCVDDEKALRIPHRSHVCPLS